jgi:hypothetical protein
MIGAVDRRLHQNGPLDSDRGMEPLEGIEVTILRWAIQGTRIRHGVLRSSAEHMKMRIATVLRQRLAHEKASVIAGLDTASPVYRTCGHHRMRKSGRSGPTGGDPLRFVNDGCAG